MIIKEGVKMLLLVMLVKIAPRYQFAAVRVLASVYLLHPAKNEWYKFQRPPPLHSRVRPILWVESSVNTLTPI